MSEAPNPDAGSPRWFASVSPGLWIAIAVVALVGGRWLWLRVHRAEHAMEIAAAFGSASLQSDPAHFDNNFAYCTYTAFADTRGVALYLRETATGKNRQVTMQRDGTGAWQDEYNLQSQPWSPDGRDFAYSTMGSLFICPVDAGLPAEELKLEQNVIPADVVWLNPSELVWLENRTLCHAIKPSDGPWAVQRYHSFSEKLSVTAIGPHQIAWLQDDCICRLDFSQDLTGTNDPFSSSTTANPGPVTNSLVLWLDASTLQQPDRTPVNTLDDRSPSQNTAAVNGSAPLFNAPGSQGALNGKGTLHFASSRAVPSSSGLKTERPLGVAGASPRTVFVVMRHGNGQQMLINIGQPGTQRAYFGICDRSYGLQLPAGWSADNNLPAEPNEWHILEAVYDGNVAQGYVNGSLKGETKVGLNTIDHDVEIGLRSGANAAGSDGDFAELLVYNRVLDPGERQQVENYLSLKWLNVQRFSHDSPLVWLDPNMNLLTGLDYSAEAGSLLLKRTENGSDTLWRVRVENGSLGKPAPVLPDSPLVDVRMQWAGANTVAYTSGGSDRRELFLADLSSGQSSSLLRHADIRWFQVTPDQKGILLGAVISNEPAMGIWRYDLGSKQLTPVVSSSGQPSVYAKRPDTTTRTFKSGGGQTINYTLFLPADFDRHKKYPLVLGDTYVPDLIYGQRLELGMAASGAVVAFVNRNYWTDNIEKWEDNVRSLYEHLRQEPYVDTQRVFLISAGDETVYMTRMLEESPGLWKGAIYVGSGQLPDFSQSPTHQNRPRILISFSGAGQEDRLGGFQEDSLQDGVLAEYITHPAENLRLVGTEATQARLEAITHFIFEE
ncbi:MAG TPA: LamG-like jellyroll fold domain-containing protein [Verrucomicrobiae bacterium]|nr:LamG-like jellyroll fold domain-containing protein [Verrucomicrobiae bacterium]